MIRLPRVHPFSALVGLGIAGLVLITTSQATIPPGTISPIGLRVEYTPHPRDMMKIPPNGTFYVPAGKIFVLTGVGSGPNYPGGVCEVGLDGVVVLTASTTIENSGGGVGNGTTMKLVPPGITAHAGSAVSVSTTGYAVGYLADA